MGELEPALTSADAARPLTVEISRGSSAADGQDPRRLSARALLDGPSSARVAAAVGRSRAANTRRGYASDWARFARWCAGRDYEPLPARPEVVAAYLADLAEMRDDTGDRAFAPSTLARWLAALNAAHRAAGHAPPGQLELVRSTLAGIRRTYADAGERRPRRRSPLLLADIRQILEEARAAGRTWAEQVRERRDSALILFGFAGAFRRSELVALTTSELALHPSDGLHILLGQSKTDQAGEGQIKALPYGRAHQTCPVCAYVRWRQVLDAWDTDGRVGVLRVLRASRTFETHVCRAAVIPGRACALFRGIHKTGAIAATPLSAQAINPMLRRRAVAAGVDPAILGRLGGHSLRVGFVTEAARAGADPASIMRQTGQKTDAMVRLYIRETAPLIGNAVTRLGL